MWDVGCVMMGEEIRGTDDEVVVIDGEVKVRQRSDEKGSCKDGAGVETC